MKRTIKILGVLTLLAIGYLSAPYAVEAVTKSSAHVFTSKVTLAGATTHSGATTHTGAYTHSGTGTRTISTTGATTHSGGDVTYSGADTDVALTGATADLTISGGGDFTVSGDGVITHSGTGATTISSSGAVTFSGGDVTLSGADTDLALTGATSDLTVSGGGDITVSSDGVVNVSGTGSYQIEGDKIFDCDTVTVSTGELLALNATPKTLVAAPGANKFVAIHSVTAALDYNSAAYDGVAAGEDLAITYTNGAGARAAPDIETTGFVDQTNDELRIVYATGTALTGGAAAAPTIPVSNAAVVLSLLVGEIATGDSPLDVRICYSIQPDLLD
jgi:hypothetical protein